MSYERPDYETVELLLRSEGISFSKPCPRHYRIFIRAMDKLVYSTKSGKVAFQHLGELEKIISLSSDAQRGYKKEVQTLAKLVAELKELKPLPEEPPPQPTFQATPAS